MFVRVTCNNDDHSGDGYTWDYNGNKNPGEQTSCPKCGYRVRIPKE